MIAQSTRSSRYFTYIQPFLRIPLIRTYGSVIFTIFALIIFIVYAIKPTVQTILVLQKTLENQQEVLKKLTKKSEDLGVARNNYQNIDPKVKSKIATAIPSTLELGSLINSLESTILGSEASISALQFQTIEVETSINTIPKIQEIGFTFNIEASYETIKSALTKLRSTGRSIIIDKLTITKVEDQNTLLMTVSGKAYYLR